MRNCYVFTKVEILVHLEGGLGEYCGPYMAMYGLSGFADVRFGHERMGHRNYITVLITIDHLVCLPSQRQGIYL